jgi:hypothetical protein
MAGIAQPFRRQMDMGNPAFYENLPLNSITACSAKSSRVGGTSYNSYQ